MMENLNLTLDPAHRLLFGAKLPDDNAGKFIGCDELRAFLKHNSLTNLPEVELGE